MATVTTAAAIALSAASAAAAPVGVPAPNKYNTTPPCPVSLAKPYCGPWNTPKAPDSFEFPYGGCEYWAYMKRSDIVYNDPYSDPLGGNWNAWTWAEHGRAEGLTVNHTPLPGAIAVWPKNTYGAGPEGHVAYVESVNTFGPGTIVISEMNADYQMQGETVMLEEPMVSELSYVYPPLAQPAKSGGPTGGHSHGEKQGNGVTHLHLHVRDHRRRAIVMIRVSRHAIGRLHVHVANHRLHARLVKHHARKWKYVILLRRHAPRKTRLVVRFRGLAGWTSAKTVRRVALRRPR